MEEVSDSGRDFFISYTGVNEPWARWIAVTLENAGYTTQSQTLDFRPGHDFVHEMDRATATAQRTIVAWSPAYSSSKFAEAEWRPAFAADPTGELGLLIPFRVQPGRPDGLLRTRVAVDLFDIDEPTARQRLLEAVESSSTRPTSAPFAGTAVAQRLPGDGPAVSNLPRRNRSFTGRTALLDELHERLHSARVAAVLPVEALHGLGGVGKTELVTEFAYRFGADYDIVWWIPAEQQVAATTALTALAARLGISTLDPSLVIGDLFEQLRRRQRWLLIYDNAERPRELVGLIPDDGDGDVLVTSRWAEWGQKAESLRVDVLTRSESVDFLTTRTGRADAESFGELADLLGDLPLALEEAAAYIKQTSIGIGEYVQLVRQRARDLFGLDPATWSTSATEADEQRIATVWSVSLDRIKGEAPAAEQILTLCSFLGAEIPRSLPVLISNIDPPESVAPVAETTNDVIHYNSALRALARYSMVVLTADSIQVHRLVQAVIRARLDRDDEREWSSVVVNLLDFAFPQKSGEPQLRKFCDELFPHLMAACGYAQDLNVARDVASALLERASLYLRSSGQYQQARPVAERALAPALHERVGVSRPG